MTYNLTPADYFILGSFALVIVAFWVYVMRDDTEDEE